MELILLKAKLHKGHVTHTELEYDGSCAIDGALLDAAGIIEYEQIHIYNLSNGERLITYAVIAESHSGIISINGAAARKAQPGDRIIICSYCAYSAEEASRHQPKLLYLDQNNHIVRTAHKTPVQLV